MLIKDVTGEEVDIKTLVERLMYRQKHPITSDSDPDKELNLFVCYEWHTREGTGWSLQCPDCKSFWRYQIKDGILRKVYDAGRKTIIVGARFRRMQG